MIKPIEYERKPDYFMQSEKRKKYKVKNLNMAKMYMIPSLGVFFCGFVNYIIKDNIVYLKYFYLKKKYMNEGEWKILIKMIEGIIKSHYLKPYKPKKTNRIFKKKFITIMVECTNNKKIENYHDFLVKSNYKESGECYIKQLRLKKSKTKK